MTSGVTDDQPLPELPPEVVERIVDELSERGEKVVGCFRTAAALIKQAVDGDRGLRLAESAGYNLREALDSVVVGRSPVSGGLPAILEAWGRYESEAGQPGVDSADSWKVLEDELRRVAQNRDRSSYHAARLIDYLRSKTGVDPLRGGLDPVVEYARLRRDANEGVHAAFVLDEVTALYDRTVAWFIRMFTPPDRTVQSLTMLASEPWQCPEQIERLRKLATNPHHLRLFCGRLVDPAWLIPLYDAGLIQLPEPDALWPAVGLLDGVGRRSPAHLAVLLGRMLADSQRLPREQQTGAMFELLRMASQIGVAGHPVVGEVVALHPGNHAVRALAVAVVKRSDPADPIVRKVADAVLVGSKPLNRADYYACAVLEALESGLHAGNVADRTRMMAAKVRRLVRNADMRFVVLDIARLTTVLGDERNYIARMTYYLARMLSRARELGVPTAQLLSWTNKTPGEIGERITCRILAEADDVPPQDMINHITRRLASPRATGDDRDLVDKILSGDPEPEMLEAWGDALGTPSDGPQDTTALPPKDWARAWRWSLALPEPVLTQWQHAIAQVAARYGAPDPRTLDHRSELPQSLTGQSAHTEDELAALSVLEAAELVARWRPDAASDWKLMGARELARALEAVAKQDPGRWSTDPIAVVTALREPVYVLHYFRALTDKATEAVPHASAILEAAKLVRTARWEPAILGGDDFDFEPDWHNVDTATVDLAAALANRDSQLAEHLGIVWTWALDLIDISPEPTDSGSSFDGFDALTRAINNPRGRGLQAVLALAGWELRNTGMVRADCAQVLNAVLSIPGKIGMEYRAVLAERRVFLESVAPAWFEDNASMLFSDDELGRETFDLTLKYARPTRLFYSRFRDELFAAARRTADHAVAWLLVGMLNEEDGYALDAVIAGLRGDTDALAASANEIAFLAQSIGSDDLHLAISVEFWRTLLDADRHVVPVDAVRSSGRWALVTGLSDDVWAQLTLRTLEITGGAIDLAIEVADRCKAAHPSENSIRILLLLLGKGEPWEQHHIAGVAIETLGAFAPMPVDESFQQLRTRLIELGHHEAADIRIDEGRHDDSGQVCD
ncbi:hypothetical protein ACH4TQ_44605 [Streptomyces sp. NPDC021218]|uniref:hypothetical protein n=1 Tax=Streptomyces sp. NPDC021218 TaxID=3365119 RepID=UPI0037B5F12D